MSRPGFRIRQRLPRRPLRRVLGSFALVLLTGIGGIVVPSQAQSTEPGTGESGIGLSGAGRAEQAQAESAPETTATDTAPEDAPTLFVQAGTAYREGRYSQAAATYLKLVEMGFDGADVRYNLGNAYLRSGELARAIAEYRKALILNPRDRDALANLSFARQSATDAVSPPEPAPWRRALLFWHDSLGWSEKVRLAVLAAMLFWALLALRLWRGRWLAAGWLSGFVAAVAVVLGLSAAAESVFPARVGVVLPVRVEVYSGTDLRSQVIFNLHAGTEVRVERTDRDWTEFTLSDGRRGWLPTEQMVLVDSRRL